MLQLQPSPDLHLKVWSKSNCFVFDKPEPLCSLGFILPSVARVHRPHHHRYYGLVRPLALHCFGFPNLVMPLLPISLYLGVHYRTLYSRDSASSPMVTQPSFRLHPNPNQTYPPLNIIPHYSVKGIQVSPG
jgi:hypothetical protein